MVEYIDSPPSHTFSTREGCETLFAEWWKLHPAEGTLDQERQYSGEQRAAFLADWLRWCIREYGLDPHKRLPPYRTLAHLFALQKKQIAPVIGQLRDEGLLPKRKIRKDKDQPQWTERDEYLWEYIGFMRAIRFDQAQRLLARESEYEVEDGRLSVSRTSEIIRRWTAPAVKYAVFRSVFHAQPGWIHLTRRGLRQIGLDFRAEVPSVGVLDHLFWINEVRMKLEDEDEDIEWISEREIQAEQDLRKSGKSVQHIPDGILVLSGSNAKQEAIDIEVQISRPSKHKVVQVMSDVSYTQSSNALRYYVNRESRRVVWAALREIQEEQPFWERPSIEIIDLEEWLPPPLIVR